MNHRVFTPVLVWLCTNVAMLSAAKLENIALGKPYTMSVKPNYAPDKGDQSDLTDGFSDPNLVWGKSSTVGWQVRRKAIVITIDLGRVEPIAGVSFSCVAGSAGVTWPAMIEVTFSENGKQFYNPVDLYRASENPLPPAYQGSVPYRARTQQLQTKGRYVRFNVLPSGTYLFCDEIEVYRGKDHWLTKKYSGQAVGLDGIKDPMRLTRSGVYRRIRSDLDHVTKLVRSQRPKRSQCLLARLQQIKTDLRRSTFPKNIKAFKAIVPFNDLHSKVFQIHSQLLRPNGVSGLTFWHTPRYQLLSLFEKPRNEVTRIQLAMAGNERRAQVFNVTNSTDQLIELQFRVEGLPGGTNPGYLRPHQVEYVDGREGEVIASALVPIGQRKGQFLTTIPSGMTRQIWLSVDWPKIGPGDYCGRIVLNWGKRQERLGFNLKIAPVRLPDKLACDLGMWDYIADINRPRYGVTRKNQAAAIRDMRQHKVNVVWGEGNSVPQIRSLSRNGKDTWEFDHDGKLKAKFDFSGWDRFVKMWPDADYYIVSNSFRTNARFCGQQEGSPSFQRAVKQFAAAWAKHNRQLGLKPGKAGILFVDEPGNGAMYKTTYLFAKAFRAGTKEIALYSDPGIGKGLGSLDKVQHARQALELCDILCPNLTNTVQRLNRDGREFFRQRQAQGARFWLYECSGPTRLGNPSYFRMQAWHALQLGATGVNFWSYSSLGAMNGWNEYPSYGSRTDSPLYFSPTTVTTSKHWEAVLESRQDYQYVIMLREKVKRLRKAGADTADLRQAKKLATGVATEVIQQLNGRFGRWFASNTYSAKNPSIVAEEGRLKVLRALTELISESKR